MGGWMGANQTQFEFGYSPQDAEKKCKNVLKKYDYYIIV